MICYRPLSFSQLSFSLLLAAQAISGEALAGALQKGHLETIEYLLSVVDTNKDGPTINDRPKLNLNDPVGLGTIVAPVMFFVMELLNFSVSHRNATKKLSEKHPLRKSSQVFIYLSHQNYM